MKQKTFMLLIVLILGLLSSCENTHKVEPDNILEQNEATQTKTNAEDGNMYADMHTGSRRGPMP